MKKKAVEQVFFELLRLHTAEMDETNRKLAEIDEKVADLQAKVAKLQANEAKYGHVHAPLGPIYNAVPGPLPHDPVTVSSKQWHNLLGDDDSPAQDIGCAGISIDPEDHFP